MYIFFGNLNQLDSIHTHFLLSVVYLILHFVCVNAEQGPCYYDSFVDAKLESNLDADFSKP